jgi:hypothetical protein
MQGAQARGLVADVPIFRRRAPDVVLLGQGQSRWLSVQRQRGESDGRGTRWQRSGHAGHVQQLAALSMISGRGVLCSMCVNA